MGDFKQAQASRSRDEGVLQPSNVTSTEKVFSQPKTEMSVATSQMPAIGSRPPKKTTKKVGLIISTVVSMLALVAWAAWFALCDNNGEPKSNPISNRDVKADSMEDKKDAKPEDNESSNIDTEIGSMHSIFKGRLYLLDGSDGVLHKQRYYLLVDDATYGVSEDFLKRKTYVMDLASVGSSDFIREVDLATAMTPFVESYISERRRENCEMCSVEYFGFSNPMMIDFEKELIFVAYYPCTMYDGGEISLGSRVYAFNVETNEIKDMGAVNW